VSADPELEGTWFVLPTPFAEDGSLDLDSQRRLVETVISWGVDGLTAMGVTSEASALSEQERDAALRTIAEAAGGPVSLAVGCSDASSDRVAERIQGAADLEASAAMVSAPPAFPDPEKLPSFFAEVASEGPLPLLIQDEPAATGVRIPVELLLRCLDSSGSRAVKLEDPPTPLKIARLLVADPTLRVFGGLGGVQALYELRRGACGTMTGFAYPEILGAVRRALRSGDDDRAARLFDRYLPLIQFEAQPGIRLAIRKEILRRRGVIATAITRTPTGTIDDETSDDLDDLLDRLGIRPGPEPFEPSGA